MLIRDEMVKTILAHITKKVPLIARLVEERDGAVTERRDAIINRDTALPARDAALSERHSGLIAHDDAVIELGNVTTGDAAVATKSTANGISANDVIASIEMILGRTPDVELVEYHLRLGFPDRFALGKHMLNTDEFRSGTRCPGPIWDERALTESREPIGILGSEAEEVFKSFTKYQGLGRSGYVTNFLGCVNNITVSSGLKIWDGTVEDYPFLGNFHGSTMEWVGTLKAVLEANNAFRMLELGAGWGPWCVIAYIAAVQRGISDIQVVGVEGDAGHIKYMEENFTTNGLRPDSYSIIPGVVGSADGEAIFPRAKDPSEVYGGVPAFCACGNDQHPFNFFMKHCSEWVDQVESVPAFSLETLMAGLPIVDLVHCDIQGGELDLFTNAIELISRKVRRVVIGTHSWQIDHGLIGLFATHGWVLEGAEDCFYRERMFHDGSQVWRNPLLTN
jgi:FkbM family methyltransferase